MYVFIACGILSQMFSEGCALRFYGFLHAMFQNVIQIKLNHEPCYFKETSMCSKLPLCLNLNGQMAEITVIILKTFSGICHQIKNVDKNHICIMNAQSSGN